MVPTGSDSQFPDLITSDNFPLFPFTDQFNTGFEVNPGNKIVSLPGIKLSTKKSTSKSNAVNLFNSELV